MEHEKLTHYLEVLCQSGCKTVNATIIAMEKNQPISFIEELNTEEQSIVLKELKAIMSVYDH